MIYRLTLNPNGNIYFFTSDFTNSRYSKVSASNLKTNAFCVFDALNNHQPLSYFTRKPSILLTLILLLSRIEINLLTISNLSSSEHSILISGVLKTLGRDSKKLSKDIDSAISIFKRKKADSVSSFCEAKPKDWYFNLNKDYEVHISDPLVSKNECKSLYGIKLLNFKTIKFYI